MSEIVNIDIETLYAATGTAKLADLPAYERTVRALAGNGNEVILTGQGPIWLYLRLAHALHGKAVKLSYDSPVTGEVIVFDHNPMTQPEPQSREEHRQDNETDELTDRIIGAAIRVHRTLGPGLLESAYQKCFAYELDKLPLPVECEKLLPLQYETVAIDAGYRLDMLVAGQVVIENKTVERLLPIHEAQLLTYLKLTGCKVGLIINWHVPLLKNGIKRMVLNF